MKACLSFISKGAQKFFLVIIAATIITSSFSPLATAATTPTDQASCTAAGGNWHTNGHRTFCDFSMSTDNTTPELRAQAYSYYHAAYKCVIDGVMNDKIHTVVGANGATEPSQGDKNLNAGGDSNKYAYEWFHDWSAYGNAYPDGKGDCYQLMQKLLDMTGSSGKDALQAMGWNFDASVPQWTAPQDRGAGLRNFIFGALGNVDQLNDNASKYPLYLNAFTNSTFGTCQGTQVGAFKSADPTLQQWASDGVGSDGKSYAKITIASGSSPTDYIYSYIDTGQGIGTKSNTSHDTPEYGTTWNWRDTHYPGTDGAEALRCNDLPRMINDVVADYITWYSNKNQTPPSATANPANCVNNPSDPSCKPSKSSCGIDNIGWLVCPVLGFMGKISDQLFSFLASSFLSIDTQTVSTKSGTYTAWSAMRNIANVVFVIVFLIIIFSQLSSVGVTNYGIKKMLPRIIIAAILVNLSFFICQIAVDLSNILGYGLKGLFNSVQALALPDKVGDATGNGFGIAVIVAAAIAGGVTLLLAITFPVLLAVVLSLLVIVFILLARKALIVLLVIIAPLAFVAYLLPNTEQWYKKWEKMFISLLVVFPVISVVFGASSLAASIIKGTPAAGDNMTPLIAIGVEAIPLIMVPSILKGSLLAAGAIGTVLKGHADRHGKNVGGKIGESKLGQLNQYRKNEAQKRRALINAGVFRGSNKNPLNWGRNAMSGSNRAFNSSSLSGGFGDRSASMGVALADKMEREEVEDQSKLVANLGGDKLREIANDQKSSATKKAAAIQRLVTISNPDEYEDIVNKYGRDTSEKNSIIRKTLSKSLAESGQQFLKASDLDVIATGGMTGSFKEMVGKNVNAGVYSERKMVSDSTGNLDYAYRAAGEVSGPGGVGQQRMYDTATALQSNETLKGDIKHNVGAIENLAGSRRPDPSYVPPVRPTPPTP